MFEYFLEKFDTDEKLIYYLEQLRWNGKPVCPHCGCDRVYKIASPKQPYKCGNKECLKKFSVKVGTLMESSPIPTNKFIFMSLNYLHNPSFKTWEMAALVGLTQKTTWKLSYLIRKKMMPIITKNIIQETNIDELLIKLLSVSK